MGDNLIRVVGVRCTKTCPILGSPIRYLTDSLKTLALQLLLFLGRDIIVPRDGSGKMMEGDQVYFVCAEEHMSRAMASLDMKSLKAEMF